MPNAFEKFTKNKPLFYGTLGVIGIGSVLYFRHRQNQAAAQANAPSSGSGVDSGDPCDPSSSAYDPTACAQMGGWVGPPWQGGGPQGEPFGPFPTNPGGPDLTTKEAWVAEAENVLPNGHSAEVRNALLGVLGGLTVTTAQKNVFLEAVGILSDPPGGYPKPIKVKDTPGHPGPHDKHKVTVPNVVGKTFDVAQNELTKAGLGVRKDKPSIHIVTSESPHAGSKVDRGTVVHVDGRPVHQGRVPTNQ